MYGFEAISHYNGWSMAIAGALIVMSGLAVLSFIISQLHRVVELIEGRGKKKPAQISLAVDMVQEAPQAAPLDAEALKKRYTPLTEVLGGTFKLSQLYEIAAANDMPHIHLSIRSLREAGVLVPEGDGVFKWK